MQLEDNIIMDLKEIDIDTRNWVDSAQDSELLESPCRIEPARSIIHGASLLVMLFSLNISILVA